MSIKAALNSLQTALKDAVNGVSVQPFDGVFTKDALAKVSLSPPCVLYSISEAPVTLVGAAGVVPQQLQHTPADKKTHTIHYALSIGIALITKDTKAETRALAAWTLAEQLMPALAGWGAHGLRVRNLYSDAFYNKGLMALAITGTRQVEGAAAKPAAQTPSEVRQVVDSGQAQKVWPDA